MKPTWRNEFYNASLAREELKKSNLRLDKDEEIQTILYNTQPEIKLAANQCKARVEYTVKKKLSDGAARYIVNCLIEYGYTCLYNIDKSGTTFLISW